MEERTIIMPQLETELPDDMTPYFGTILFLHTLEKKGFSVIEYNDENGPVISQVEEIAGNVGYSCFSGNHLFCVIEKGSNIAL